MFKLAAMASFLEKAVSSIDKGGWECQRHRSTPRASSESARTSRRTNRPDRGLRISVLLPNSDSTRSTASTAVLLRTSRAGFSSMMSSEPTGPVSAIISMHSCASR